VLGLEIDDLERLDTRDGHGCLLSLKAKEGGNPTAQGRGAGPVAPRAYP
jgi:hypothetical protein